MDEQQKQMLGLLGLLLPLTVQLVCLAVQEHQQQTETHHTTARTCLSSSFTPQDVVIPVLALWESLHTTATTYLSRLCGRSVLLDNDEGEGEGDGELEDAAERHPVKNSEVRRSNKRRRTDCSVHRDRAANVVTTGSASLQCATAEHLHGYDASQAQNRELDRLQRNERSDQLAAALGELAHVISLIADRL